MAFDPNTGLPIQPPVPPTPPAPPQPIVVHTPPAPAPTPQAPTWDEINARIEAARKEEKDKLYPEIERLKQVTAEFEREKQEREEALAAEQARLEEEQRRQSEEEMSAKDLLAQTNATWEQRFAELQAERDREAALRAKEAELYQLEQYKQSRIAQEAENIEPRFIDFIRGSNQEEIENSIALMKQKTAELMADIQAAQQGQRRSLGLPTTSGPPIDMAGVPDASQRSLSAQDIAQMDMEEYQQLRPQLLGAVSERVRTQGPYAP